MMYYLKQLNQPQVLANNLPDNCKWVIKDKISNKIFFHTQKYPVAKSWLRFFNENKIYSYTIEAGYDFIRQPLRRQLYMNAKSHIFPNDLRIVIDKYGKPLSVETST